MVNPKNIYPVEDSDKTLSCQIAYTPNGGFCIPLSSRHRPAASKILSGSTYEPNTIDFICKHRINEDVIHAGTYYGDFLPNISNSRESNYIWAFEPVFENYRCAQITCLLNNLKNVCLYNSGLGTQFSNTKIKTHEKDGIARGGGSYIVQSTIDQGFSGTFEDINIVSLDQIIPENRQIGILHLDVEKYEQYALQGALNLISRCKPIIIIETIPSEDWMEKYLYNLGYSFIKKVHMNSVFSIEPLE